MQARANARIRRIHQERDQKKPGEALDKLKEAIGDYRQALEANQENSLARAQLAAALMESGQFKQAVGELEHVLKLDENYPDLLLKRAQALMKSGEGRPDRAYADFLAAGRLFKGRGLFDDADTAYSGAVGLLKDGVEGSRQDQAKVHAELAEVQENRAFVAGNEDRRRKLFRAACEHFSAATNLDEKVLSNWDGLARCQTLLKEWKEARETYEKALKLSPGHLALTESLALVLIQLKEWDEAARRYLAIIEVQPKVLLYRLNLAAIYLQPIPPEKNVRPERLEMALSSLEAASKVEGLSQQSFLWPSLAAVQLAAGKVDEYKATRTRMFEASKTSVGDDANEEANNLAWAAAFAEDTPEGAGARSSWPSRPFPAHRKIPTI